MFRKILLQLRFSMSSLRTLYAIIVTLCRQIFLSFGAQKQDQKEARIDSFTKKVLPLFSFDKVASKESDTDNEDPFADFLKIDSSDSERMIPQLFLRGDNKKWKEVLQITKVQIILHSHSYPHSIPPSNSITII